MSFLGGMGAGAAIQTAFVAIRPDTSTFSSDLDSGIRGGLSGAATRIREAMAEAGEDGGSRLAAGIGAGAEIAQEHALAIGAAFVAAGAGLEAWSRSQQAANVDLGRLATATQMTEGELRSLVGELDNVTFSTDEVIAVLGNASAQQVRTRDEMIIFAQTWDMVADATGESVVALSDAGVALQALDVDDPRDALDAFGFIAQETTSSVGEFLAFVERTGPQLRELNLDVDDTAAIMGVLERELGLTGRTARSEFRAAVNEADGDLGVMLETLGVTPEAFAAMRTEVEGSSAALEENAQKYADSFTPLQRLQSFLSETVFQFGGLADAAGIAAGALTATGPAVMAVAHAGPAMSALGAATGHVRGAMVALRGVMMAHPIMTLATVAGGVAAAFGLLGGSSDNTRERIDALADAMRNAEDAATGLNNFLGQLITDTPELARAMDHAGLSLDDLTAAAAGGDESMAAFNRELAASAEEMGFSIGEMGVLARSVDGLASQYATAAQENEIANRVMAETTDAAGDADDALADLAAAHVSNAEGMRGAAEAAEEMAAVMDAVAEEMTAAAQTVIEEGFAEVEATADALQARVDSAMSSAASHVMRFSDDAKNSLDVFRGELGQNTIDLASWQNDLITIAERASGDFALEIAELGPEFSGMVSELSRMSDDEFAAFVDEMTGATGVMQRDMAAEFAKVDPEFKKTLDGVAGMTQYEMIVLEMQASQEAFKVGQAMASGMEAGVNAGADRIAARAAQVVRDAMNAAKREGEISSPSRLFAREIGAPIAEGIAMGIAGGQRDIDRALAEMLVPPSVDLAGSTVPFMDRPPAVPGGAGWPSEVTLIIEGAPVSAIVRDRMDDSAYALAAGRRP